MSVTNVCRHLVMHICTSKYPQPLLATITDPPASSRSDQGTLSESSCACDLVSGSYGALCVFDRTD